MKVNNKINFLNQRYNNKCKNYSLNYKMYKLHCKIMYLIIIKMNKKSRTLKVKLVQIQPQYIQKADYLNQI